MLSPVEEIKSRLDIVEVVQDYVPLKVSGTNLKGLCPFHREKSPSFMVHKGRQRWHCFGCFPPGQKVKTPFGLHNIEELDNQHFVYSGKGRIRKVLATQSRHYSGDLVHVEVRKLGGVVSLTKDHHLTILRPRTAHVKRTKQFYRQVRAYAARAPDGRGVHGGIERYGAFLEITAGDLQIGDFVSYPIPTTINDIQALDLSPYRMPASRFGPRPQALSSHIAIDEDFLKLLGYYIAEGSEHRAYIRFSLGSHEGSFAQEIVMLMRKIFNIDARIHERRGKKTGIEITACHSHLAGIFKNLCGHTAAFKHIPFALQEIPPYKQLVLIHAIAKGDGTTYPSHRSRHMHTSITTISRVLAEQLIDALLRNDFFPTLTTHPETFIKGVRHKPSYNVIWSREAVSQHRLVYEDLDKSRTWLLPVRKVTRSAYDGPVYNLTVEGEHSYVATNFAVGNCGEGGDIFTFIEKVENVDFKEALELLAKRANVELKMEDPRVRSERTRMKETLALAARWFQAHLNATGGKEAREYLHQQRGLDDATIAEWQIGFAPDSWEGLVTALQKRGHTAHELIAAGMAIQKREGQGCYDRFRGRIMFPIADGNSTVVGFTGRLLHERPDAGGKYVNTPETMLYKKSMVLFGLNKAREGIKEQKYALIVEGQMDVIALWQYGYRHAVASSGTAFTQEQLRLLKRYTDTLVLCFDADAGGQAAALRSIEAAWSEGFRVQVVAIPRTLAKDPDELVRKDKDAFEETLKGRELFLDYLYRRAFAQHDKEGVDGKKAIAQEILSACVKLADPIEQDHYIKRLASDLNIHEASLRDAMKRLVIPVEGQFIRRQGGTPQNVPPKKTQEEKVTELLIEAILVQPEVMEKVAEILEEGDVPAVYAPLYKDCVLWYSKNTIRTSDNLRSFLEASYPEAISLIESLITKRELLHQSRENSGQLDEDAPLKESLTLARTLKRIALKRRIDVYSHTLKKIEQDKEIDARRVQVEEISAKIEEASQALASLDVEEDVL